jgi:tetratricopeptide (TPR) repeat protein
LTTLVDPTSAQHEETIVPVRPGFRPAAAETPPAAPGGTAVGTAWLVAAGAVVLALLFGAFFLLPRWMTESETANDAPPPPAAAPAAVPTKPQLSPQQLAELQKQADALLAGLLTQQKDLAAHGAETWGGDDWARYSALSDAGDDAYLAKDFEASVARYAEATALGEALAARSQEIVDSAFTAGKQALLAGNADVAIKQLDIVLGIEPEHAGAKAERARAERLPQVLALVQRGDAQRQAGEAQEAIASYREALAIDPAWEAARTALDEVSGSLKSLEFEQAMSKGLAALAAQDFLGAKEHFTAALRLRPDARPAQEGLAESEQGTKLGKIELAEARASAFERRELWAEAIAQYREALAVDPNLAFAITGLERAQARQSLEAKLKNLIDNPTLLFSDSVLADTRKLLDEANAQEERGPRLAEQIDKLTRLATLASTPVKVEQRSDQLTEVTLFRVGTLGTFTAKEVELRPGTYTAVGSRNGYRDVRQTFTVVPGRDVPPINVVCVEAI